MRLVAGDSRENQISYRAAPATLSHDFEVAHHLASTHPVFIEKPLDCLYADVYSGIVALVHKDKALLDTAVNQFLKTDPAYVKAIKSAIGAVASGSAVDFSTALNKMLSAYNRYMYGDELYCLIDPHAHGLYELCRRFSPDIVREFDVERKLPWDREYFEWLSTVDDISEHIDTAAIPEVMHPLIVTFQPIPWGAAVRERW